MKDDLNNEIELIRNVHLKEFAYYTMKLVPDYFFHVAASSSGKYHPNYALGEGGLVRHVKAAVKIAESLLELEQNKHLDHDTIIFALIFHDCLKHGKEDCGHTEFLHLIHARQFILENYNNYSKKNDIDPTLIDSIYDCIGCHVGEWNTSKYSDDSLLKPFYEEEKFVRMCDYLASRKFIEVEVI